MSELTHGPEAEFTPTELLELATAMAERDVIETRENNILNAAVGIEQQPIPTEVAARALVNKTALSLRLLSEPDRVLTSQELVSGIFDEELLRLAMEADEKPDTPEAREQTLGEITALITAIVETTDPDVLRPTERIAATRTVAARNGVSLAEVFKNDELYNQLYREQYTPEMFADKAIADIDKIRGSLMNNMIRQFVWAEINLDKTTTDEEKQAEFEELLAELQSDLVMDDELREQLDAILAAAVQVSKMKALSIIERVWGIEAAINLPTSILGRLALDDQVTVGPNSSSEALREMALLRQRRADVIKSTAQLNGWDPAQLSMAQLKEIHASQAWRDLSVQES